MNTSLIILAPGLRATETLGSHPCAWRDGHGVQRGTLDQLVDIMRSVSTPLSVVMSAADGLVANVTLSRRQARHIRRILPFVLEDLLLDAPEKLWFAHGKGKTDQYPVVLTDQDTLIRVRDYFTGQGLKLKGIWLDADLLTGHVPLVAHSLFGQDALIMPEARKALYAPSREAPSLLTLTDVDLESLARLDTPEDLVETLRAALSAGQGINLLHSEMRPSTVTASGQRRTLSPWMVEWLPFARVAAVVLVTVWVLMIVQQVRYDRAATAMTQHANALYEALYPEDRAQVLVAQFSQRIRQTGGAEGGSGGLLPLLSPAGEALAGMTGSELELRRIQFDERDGLLLVEVNASDFGRLELVRDTLVKQGLTAEITDGRAQGDRVTARIRIGKG